MRVKKTAPEPTVKLTREQLDVLGAEIRQSNLSSGSKAIIINVLVVFLQIQLLLKNKKVGLLAILRRFFGLKTERHAPNCDKKKPDPSSDSTNAPHKKKD